MIKKLAIFTSILVSVLWTDFARAGTAEDAWYGLVGEAFSKRPEFYFVENDPALPNVLLYGDSISIGYTERVRAQLKGKANVYRLYRNGGESATFIPKMTKMHDLMQNKDLDRPWDFQWDVIHFNVGLHDLKYVRNGKLDKENGELVATTDQYKENLRKIVAYLKELAPKAKLVFATTTPVPEDADGRFAGDAEKYNRAALEALSAYPSIKINDLYAFTKPQQKNWWINPGNVHYSEKGTNSQGDEVAKVILDALSQESEEAFNERMKWFTDAQFGLFIHYGVYSTLGGEWKGESVPRYAEWIQRWGKIPSEEYYPLAADFSPDKLDADLWVRTAKEAGMKYMVITTKHHEGFCLWDSSVTDYDIGEATDFKRDILGELKAACEKYGLKFGTYYSIIDWHHPSQRVELATNQPPMYDKDGYVTYMKAQLKELIDRYDPAIMWFDGDWVKWWTMEDGLDLYSYLRELSPNMIINNRVAKRAEFKKDYGTPENSTPGGALDHVWEACWTVNHSWGYKKSDTTWKSIDVLIQKQIDINAKGGNLLLNVGPYADGSWPEASTELLKQMGAWNAAHEEAVYGTEFVMVPEQRFGPMAKSKGSNEQEGELFAYVFDWPESGKLIIENITFGKVAAKTYKGRKLPTKVVGNNLEIDLSKAKPESSATVLRIAYSGGMTVQEQSIDLGLKGDELILEAGNAEVTGRKLVLINKKYVSGWMDDADRVSWTLNVPAPGKYLVKVLYANDVEGSPVTVSVGGQTLSGKIEATGSKNHYDLAEVGVLDLDQVGTSDCSISFGKPSSPRTLKVKTLIFEPVAY